MKSAKSSRDSLASPSTSRSASRRSSPRGAGSSKTWRKDSSLVASPSVSRRASPRGPAPKTWRSGSIQVLVKMRELMLSQDGQVNTELVSMCLKVLTELSRAFSGTGYDEVMVLLNEVFRQAIFSEEMNEISTEPIPYYELAKGVGLGKRKIRKESIMRLPHQEKKFDINPFKLKVLKKVASKQDVEIHDLKYKVHKLEVERKELLKNIEEERTTRARAFSELKSMSESLQREIYRQNKEISSLRLITDAGNEQETKFSDLKQSLLSSVDGSGGLFSDENQLVTLEKFHEQMEVVENRKLCAFNRQMFEDQHRKRNKMVEQREQQSFLHGVKVVLKEMRNLQNKTETLVKKEEEGESEESKKKKRKKKSEIEIEQDKRNSFFVGDVDEENEKFYPLDTVNHTKSDSMMEVFIQKRNTKIFRLLLRKVVTEKFSPTIVDLPPNVTKLKVGHTRYNPRLSHSNLRLVLEGAAKDEDAEVDEVEKAGEPKDDDPLWRFYIKTYGRNFPLLTGSMGMGLGALRQIAFKVFYRENSFTKKYRSFKEAPSIMELLLSILREMYVLPEVCMKMLYVVLRAVERFLGHRDIKEFYLAITEQREPNFGRCVAIFHKFIETSFFLQKFVPNETEELLQSIYGVRESGEIAEEGSLSDVVMKQMEEFFGEKIAKEKGIGVEDLLMFFIHSLSECHEYWCNKFILHALSLAPEKSKMDAEEFTICMKKIFPKVTPEEVKFRFEQVLSVQKKEGKEIDSLVLSRVFASIKLMKSLEVAAINPNCI